MLHSINTTIFLEILQGSEVHKELHKQQKLPLRIATQGSKSRELLAENGGFEQPFAHVLLGELAINQAFPNPNFALTCTPLVLNGGRQTQ
jgi:hypothetical protein